jgi:GDSL-like Lipase/Acylhydrolase family
MNTTPRWMIALLFLFTPTTLGAESPGGKEPLWVAPMKKVHARFKGTPGTFAHFGDSITVSMAFWSSLAGKPQKMDPQTAREYDLVKKTMRPECWNRWKGPAHGNQGSMTIRWAHDNVNQWLKKLNPETVLIMFGTNDLNGVPLDEYERKTRAVVRRCLDNGSVVILSTIPPRSGRLEQSRRFADVVRKIARDEKVPLLDYFAEVLKRRPDDWDGSMKKFKEIPGGAYDVPTLISRDGVHPSNPGKFKDLSEESLKHNGYMLRSYLTLRAYAEVIRHVLKPE